MRCRSPTASRSRPIFVGRISSDYVWPDWCDSRGSRFSDQPYMFQINPTCRWLIVDPGEETCRRYRRLLGQTTLTTLDSSLIGLNNDLTGKLKAGFPHLQFRDRILNPRQ